MLLSSNFISNYFRRSQRLSYAYHFFQFVLEISYICILLVDLSLKQSHFAGTLFLKVLLLTHDPLKQVSIVLRVYCFSSVGSIQVMPCKEIPHDTKVILNCLSNIVDKTRLTKETEMKKRATPNTRGRKLLLSSNMYSIRYHIIQHEQRCVAT